MGSSTHSERERLMRSMFFPGGAANPTLSGEADPNVQFYKNAIPSKPDGAKCEDIHQHWDGDFERLEMHHGYIQWLFPVFENAGMNWESQPLSKSGAAIIRQDPAGVQPRPVTDIVEENVVAPLGGGVVVLGVVDHAIRTE